MDPLTHALIGAGIAGLAGGEMSITNPVVIAAVLGAIAPDLDIVYQFKGDMAYLRTHRGFSHSIPGLAVLSGFIAACLGYFFPETAAGQLFWWAFGGALSHTFLDVLNSYGAQIFAPFSKKRYTWNLLMITDPVLLLMFFSLFFLPGGPQLKSLLSIVGLSGYLLLRLVLRNRVEHYLSEKCSFGKLKRLAVMPSMIGLWTWDFVIETEQKCLVGQINSFDFRINIRKKLSRFKKADLLQAALETKLGKLFKEFTPHFYLVFNEVNDRYIVNFFDLRYLLHKEFLHMGTAVFDRHFKVVETFFQPYNKHRKIDLGA